MIKIKQKLLIQAILLAVIPAIILATINTWQANKSTFSALEKKSNERLVSLREVKKSQINDYLQQIESQVVTLAKNPSVKDAASNFIKNFNDNESKDSSLLWQKTKLTNYYQNEFSTTFSAKNNNVSADVMNKYNLLSPTAKYYQSKYIAENQYSLGNKNQLISAGNTLYDLTHKKYHPIFNDYLKEFGYYDIFIADAKTGDIVYSVYKELDYATSLTTGPYAKSGIAQAFEQALNLPNTKKNQSTLVDFSSYYPSYNQAASFVASPIRNDSGDVTAVLIFQMPIDGINKIMTNNGQWQQVGLGLSGETYLVGPDKTLRSESRFLIEDKHNYYKALSESSGQPNLALIKSYGSALGLQFADTVGVKEALQGNSGVSTFEDYRGVSVLSAFTHIEYGNQHWALMAEIDVDEAFHAAEELSDSLISQSTITLLIIAFIAVLVGLFTTNRLVHPLNLLVKNIADIAEGQGDLTAEISLAKRDDEIGDIGKAFNRFVSKIRHIIVDIDLHASQLSSASEELSAVTSETNNIVILQKAKTEETSQVMSEVNANINEIAENSFHTAELTNEASNESLKVANLSNNARKAISELGKSVGSAATELHELNNQVEDISSILSVIESIAEQTNLLALNAAIEAARAGETGRGFSVVADEVRNLAGKTQESTIEIKEKINRLKASSLNSVIAMENASTEADKGIILVKETAQTLTVISELVSNISVKNTDNASVAKQQSHSVSDVHNNIIDIAEYTESSSSSAEQTSQASEELAALAINMSNIVQQFKY